MLETVLLVPLLGFRLALLVPPLEFLQFSLVLPIDNQIVSLLLPIVFHLLLSAPCVFPSPIEYAYPPSRNQELLDFP